MPLCNSIPSARRTGASLRSMIDCRAGAPPAPTFGKRSACPTKILQRPNDQLFSLIHREGQRLQHKMIAVAIDDHAGQSVAFAPDEAAKSRIDPAPRPVLDRLRDPALKEIEIEILFPPRKTPRHDLRFGVVNRAPEKTVAAVLERNDVAVGRIAEHFQDLAAEHPIVSMQNPRARFNDKAAHRCSLTGRGNSRASGSPRSGSVIPVPHRRQHPPGTPNPLQHRITLPVSTQT